MRSLFVKGLMCATLFRLGVGCVFDLMTGWPDGWFDLVCTFGFTLALPLALLLFTSNQLVARIALIVLAAAAILQIATMLLALATHQRPPAPWSTELELFLIYAFPCVVALIVGKREANTRSNQAMKRIATD